MLPSKDKTKEKDKQSIPQGKPSSAFVTINHEDEKKKLIVGYNFSLFLVS